MTVGELLPRLSGVIANGTRVLALSPEVLSREVTAIAYDSRRVIPGAIFVAVRGERFDAAQFVADAADRGAVLSVSASDQPIDSTLPGVRVTDARRALAELASAFYRDPSRDLTVIGVTGTNGKTTTTYLLASILEAAGTRCGRVGSVAYQTGAGEKVAVRTTPEAPDVQALLREMVENHCTACVMEVSSHALAQRRADGIHFAAAVFSNLSRDHLDYHLDMGRYFETKRRLFDMLPTGAPAILNTDDPYGRRLADGVGRPVTYAIDRPADVTPDRIESTATGSWLDLRTPRGRLQIRSLLAGRLNIYNVLAAVTAAVALDLPFQAIEQGVAGLAGVPGRFETVSGSGDDVWVLVDFAHTDDALRALLSAVREFCDGRIITVFGCGGERDRNKRPLMGAMAARLSDLVVLTSDNPRSEDPDEIIDDIRRGIGSTGPVHLSIADRAAAIEHAVQVAEAGDAIVIAGKGHETEQVVGVERRPFDDRMVARSALEHRRVHARLS